MKDIPAIKGRHYINSLIAEGEHERQDFKFIISDARKIARSISAFANHLGGHLLIGVKDNGIAAGIRNEEDIYMVEAAAEIYCSPAQTVDFTAFKVDPGIIVVRAAIPQSPVPVSVKEADGILKAYIRVADENIVAPPEWHAAHNPRSGNSSPLIQQGSVLRYGPHEQLLLDLINSHGPVTLSQFIAASRLPTSTATNIAGSLISSGIITLSYLNRAWHLSLPS